MKFMTKILVILLIVLNSANVYGLCESNKAKHFLCIGDKAWATGYLIAPEKVESLRVQSINDLNENEKLKELISKVQRQRDSAIASAAERTLLSNAMTTIINEQNKVIKEKYSLGNVIVVSGISVGVGILIGAALLLRK